MSLVPRSPSAPVRSGISSNVSSQTPLWTRVDAIVRVLRHSRPRLGLRLDDGTHGEPRLGIVGVQAHGDLSAQAVGLADPGEDETHGGILSGL